MALVFDIETVGLDFDQLDETTKASLTRWISRDGAIDANRQAALLDEVKSSMGLSPLTGEIAAIGVYDTEKHLGVVYFQSPALALKDYQEENFIFKPRTEAAMLAEFWQGASQYTEFVSFNGRGFDVPFLNIRSAVHQLRPTRDLMARRYLSSSSQVVHIDLLDQLSYYGAVRRKGSLHLYCRAFNVTSPKGQGITGEDISRLFQERRYQDIAEYNSWDLIATAELYKIWQEYLRF
ncbi:MAG: ribonuclease H-like domain-containing protein [Candidatus Falkowbacteria bacterium]